MFKFDKQNAAFVGLYIASDLLGRHVQAKKQARIDAINAEFDAQEAELRKRLALLNSELASLSGSNMVDANDVELP